MTSCCFSIFCTTCLYCFVDNDFFVVIWWDFFLFLQDCIALWTFYQSSMARFRAGGLKFFFRYIFRMSSSRDYFLWFYYGLADFTVAAFSFSRFCTGWFYWLPETEIHPDLIFRQPFCTFPRYHPKQLLLLADIFLIPHYPIYVISLFQYSPASFR